jgi:TRAP-type C4-dicarboxylate transport system permease small subunit
MSDRGFCFLFSCAVILASLGATGWLLATGQAATVDGLFLMLMCLTVAAGFALYVMYMIKRAMETPAQPPAKPAKAAATPAAAKPAPLVPAEKAE